VLANAGGIEDTATVVLATLSAGVGEDVARRRDWPKNARALSSHLRRLVPNLRTIGIHVHLDRRTPGTNSRRLIAIHTADSCDMIDEDGATRAPLPASHNGHGASHRPCPSPFSRSGCVDGDGRVAKTGE
jgi:hypothetical protein